MPRRRATRLLALGLVAAGALVATGVPAQDTGDTERKLRTVKQELEAVAAERREVESERGAATRQLREADERVAASGRQLHETEQALEALQERLQALETERDALESRRGGQRRELAELLRAAYAQGEAAPLKLLLAQDRVEDANRLLTYHGYLQRERVERIRTLSAELAGLDTLEVQVAARRAELEEARARQRAQLSQHEEDRAARKALVARLDERYQDRRQREQALGRDARGLEQVLERLRAAAARAAAERKAAAERAEREAREAREAARRQGQPAPAPAPRPAPVASGPAVGGAGWPLAGNLIAGYGASMPDGRKSDGLLIGAKAGTEVKAVADGTVVYAEWMSGFGLILIVDHGNGYMSLYAHNDAVLMDAGDPVRRGDAVATVGTSGGHGRPALYFELRRNGSPVDPAGWLKR
ncbi:MAG: peptidoglycan DD-metalloendopeptidase family protein [Lysobacter spongiicola]|nr:peptidoglycan DD-metalloendopeptidase family protein [Lysobacter spongiicola]